MLTKLDIEQYFLAEKWGGLIALCIGSIAIAAAIICYFTIKNNWSNGFIIPLVIIGFIQIAAGYTVYKRSDNDRKNNVYAYDLRPEKLHNEELPRMQKAAKSFVALKYAQLALIALSIIIILVLNDDQRKTFWVGLAMGLLLQATVSFVFDAVAEKRGKVYLEKLKRFKENLMLNS